MGKPRQHILDCHWKNMASWLGIFCIGYSAATFSENYKRIVYSVRIVTFSKHDSHYIPPSGVLYYRLIGGWGCVKWNTKARPWPLMGNVYGEFHAPCCTLYTSFYKLRKSNCSRLKRLNISSVHSSTWSCSERSLHWFCQLFYFVELVYVFNLLEIFATGRKAMHNLNQSPYPGSTYRRYQWFYTLRMSKINWLVTPANSCNCLFILQITAINVVS